MRNIIPVIACLSVCGILLLPVYANALSVKIDPGRFQGRWRVGASSPTVGPATLDLLPGQTYQLNIDQVGNLPFTVLSDGTVSSNRPASATGSGNTLSFKTILVHIKPGQFPVPWHLASISKPKVGPGSVTLVPGLTYELSFGSMGGFLFTLLADGTVLSHRPEAAQGAGNTLVIATTRVMVNPGNFLVPWYISDVSTPHQGPDTLDLVPGLTYDLSLSNIGGFQFFVSDKGIVSSLNPESAIGNGNSLSFKTTPVAIDPGNFLGTWVVLHVSELQFGAGQTDLIPGLTYTLSINEIGRFQFDVKADGSVFSKQVESATASGNTLVFKTTPIKIKQSGSLKNWAIPWIPVGLSSDTVDLVPGFTYTLFSKGKRGNFMLRGPCTITPSTVILAKSTFHLVCTEHLNTPPIAVPGPDQIIFLGETALLDGSHSSDPDGDPLVSYQWSIDSAPVGSKKSLSDKNQASTQFTPDKAGNYLLALKVNDGKLNSPVKTLHLSVLENRAPVVKASATPDSGSASLEVLFDATESSDPEGEGLDYAWDFGDPESGIDNFSILSQISHIYHNPGQHRATLTVSDRLGMKSTTRFDIHVKAPDLPPTVVLFAMPENDGKPRSIQFKAEASDPEGAELAYQWDFGDSSESSIQVNPVHQYEKEGSYDVQLLVSDGVHVVETTSKVDVTVTLEATNKNVASPQELRFQKIKGHFGKDGGVINKITLDIGFVPAPQIGDRDRVKVVFDQTTLFEIPFGQFIEMHDTPGKFMYKAKDLKVRIDMKKGRLQVIRQEINLKNLGGREALELLVVFGQRTGSEPVYFDGTKFTN